jgi:hypothetical protein
MSLLKSIRARLAPKPPAPLTDFAIVVQERPDGTMALLVKVSKTKPNEREEKKVFAITDRLDPRLESYLRELADAERSRRLSAPRAKRTKPQPAKAQLLFEL